MVMNVVVFVAVLLVTRDPGALTGSATEAHLRLGLSREVLAQPIAWQIDGEVIITEPNGWYRLLTSGFMHFGVLHIAFNMYFLYVLGGMLEPALGRVRFTLLYLASLLGGSLGVVLLGGTGITAGASGAVFGLLGAATIGLVRRGVNPFSTGLGATLVLNLVITFAIPGISIGGHVGGLIAGSICGFVMLAPAYKGFPAWASYATPLAVGLGSILASIALVNG
jgi:membrane associated rhomboid family serine protease